VQYSAHRARDEAAVAADRLAVSLGRPARIVAVDLARQGRYYRVMVGGFASAAAAERFRREAIGQGSIVGPVHRVAGGVVD
jgi:hypothetical protein